MADTTRRICYACGQEFEEYQMIKFTTGRTHYICWDCYKEGRNSAVQHEIKVKLKGVKK